MNRRGFTIVELLVTIALAAVVMIALMKVIGSTSRTAKAIASIDKRAAWQTDVLGVIEWDLANATEVSAEANSRLVILGYGALDRRTSEPKHEPVEVVYELVETSDAFVLVRRQTQLNDPTNLASNQEMLCMGLRSFSASVDAPKPIAEVVAEESEEESSQNAPPPAPDGKTDAISDTDKIDNPGDDPGLRMPPRRKVTVTMKWLDTNKEDLTQTYYVWQ